MKRVSLYVLSIVVLSLLLAGCDQSGSFARNDLTAPLAPSTLAVKPDALIRVKGGSLTISRTTGVGTVELKGTRGFRLSSVVSIIAGNFAPYFLGPFPPGTTIPLTAVWAGIDLLGEVKLQGTTYDIGHPNGPGAEVRFSGEVTAPPANASGFVSAPFSFEGLVQTPPELGGPFPLTGHGQAHLQFTFNVSLGGWEFLNALYEFEASAAHGPE